MAATSVAASLSLARGLGKPLAAAGASSLRASPRAHHRSSAVVVVRASAQQQQKPVKEWAAAAAVAAALVLPEVAEAAQPGLSPSLKNFLLSIVSGGVVLVAIVGAVVAVSNFDPVKRG